MIVPATLVTLIILLLIVFLRQKSKCPPGPFPWPIIGNQYYLHKLTHQLGGQHLAFSELGKIYNSGIIKLQLGINDVIIVMNNKLIQEIYFSKKYDGRPCNQLGKLRSKRGITFNDGIEWSILRSWSIRTLKNVGLAKQRMIDLITEETTLIIAKLGNGGVIQIRPIIAPAVINVLWILATGEKPSDTRMQKLLHLIDCRATLFDMTGGLISSFPWLRYIAPEMTGYNFLVTLDNELKSFIRETIQKHKERYVKGNEMNFIDMFLSKMYNSENEEYKNVFSEDNLFVTLIDLFIASSDTNPSMLDVLFLLMVNYQDVQHNLHQEIDTIIEPSRHPRLEDRVKMPYTQAIITECQRIYSFTPLIGRRALSDTILDGYHIPKDTTVFINVYLHNMNPEFYPDPTSFKPERFIGKNGTYLVNNNVITFGNGKRKCLGEALAKPATFLIFVGIMQKYRLFPEPGKKFGNFDIIRGLTISPKPYKTLIVPR